MPTFSGLRCQIRTPAGILPEYDYPDDDDYHQAYSRWQDVPEYDPPAHLRSFQSCYIQSTPDSPFLVRVAITQDFFDLFPDVAALAFYITLDGHRNILSTYRGRVTDGLELAGTLTYLPGVKRGLVFRTRDPMGSAADADGDLASMGKIRVDVHRFDLENAPRMKSKTVLREWKEKWGDREPVRAKAVGVGGKVAKGNDMEHGVELDRTVAAKKLGPVSLGVELHPKDKPLASFVFHYRSENALRYMGIPIEAPIPVNKPYPTNNVTIPGRARGWEALKRKLGIA